jgi:hypothetical protein
MSAASSTQPLPVAPPSTFNPTVTPPPATEKVAAYQGYYFKQQPAPIPQETAVRKHHGHRYLHIVIRDHHCYLADNYGDYYNTGRDNNGDVYPVYQDPGTGADYPLYYDNNRDSYYRCVDNGDQGYYRNYVGDPDDQFYEGDPDQQEECESEQSQPFITNYDVNYASYDDYDPDYGSYNGPHYSRHDHDFVEVLPIIVAAYILLERSDDHHGNDGQNWHDGRRAVIVNNHNYYQNTVVVNNYNGGRQQGPAQYAALPGPPIGHFAGLPHARSIALGLTPASGPQNSRPFANSTPSGSQHPEFGGPQHMVNGGALPGQTRTIVDNHAQNGAAPQTPFNHPQGGQIRVHNPLQIGSQAGSPSPFGHAPGTNEGFGHKAMPGNHVAQFTPGTPGHPAATGQAARPGETFHNRPQPHAVNAPRGNNEIQTSLHPMHENGVVNIYKSSQPQKEAQYPQHEAAPVQTRRAEHEAAPQRAHQNTPAPQPERIHRALGGTSTVPERHFENTSANHSPQTQTEPRLAPTRVPHQWQSAPVNQPQQTHHELGLAPTRTPHQWESAPVSHTQQPQTELRLAPTRPQHQWQSAPVNRPQENQPRPAQQQQFHQQQAPQQRPQQQQPPRSPAPDFKSGGGKGQPDDNKDKH